MEDKKIEFPYIADSEIKLYMKSATFSNSLEAKQKLYNEFKKPTNKVLKSFGLKID